MSTLTINNNFKILKNSYNLYVPFQCIENGWENGTTCGSVTCDGDVEFKFSEIIGIQNGFIRFLNNGDNEQYGTYRTNWNPIILNNNIDINELFRTTVFAQCGGTYQCYPAIYSTIYNLEYSTDGLSNWQSFNLNVG